MLKVKAALQASSTHNYLFTVFTPTYNRYKVLERVYNSLTNQTCRDFEWLIVDDGSTDGTYGLVAQWQNEANFPIRYLYQDNSGKHVAWNLAVQKALGEFFLVFDSDDACIPTALERFIHYWSEIPDLERTRFAGVSARCMYFDGKPLVSSYPFTTIDSQHIEITHKYKLLDDKWYFFRTEVMKKFQFPVYVGETFLNEGVIYNRISKEYSIKYCNEVLKIIEYREDGLTRSMPSLRFKNPKGMRLYHQEYLNLDIPFPYNALKLRSLINYIRYSFHAKVSPSHIVAGTKFKTLTLFFLGLGYFIFKIDCNQNSISSF
jgi:glycosyltransferase involved in cell wall biosynthesis